jgi:hypothetical protein
MRPETASEHATAPSEDDLLRASDRVAELLEELRGLAGPTAWQRIEELVQRLLQLYGAGLERILRHAADAEREDGALAARLRSDALVSSLLLLHGLHPAPTRERVERAVELAGQRLGTHALELLGVDGDGTVRLRAIADPARCPSSGATVARAIERTIVEAAPEVRRVDVLGLEPAPDRNAGAGAPGAPLVQLGRRADPEAR